MKNCFIAMASLLLFSCSSDSEKTEPPITPSEPPSSYNLAGRWDLVSQSINGQSQQISGCEELYNWYEFGTDNAAIFGQYHLYSVGMTNYCDQYTGQGSYSISDSVLTYSEGANIAKYNIVSANSLTIKLEMFYKISAGQEFTIPHNQRVIDICNRVQ